MSFVMSGNEILSMYRQAKDRRTQVKILADLNATTPRMIAEFLTGCGEEVDKRFLQNPRKRPIERERERERESRPPLRSKTVPSERLRKTRVEFDPRLRRFVYRPSRSRLSLNDA